MEKVIIRLFEWTECVVYDNEDGETDDGIVTDYCWTYVLAWDCDERDMLNWPLDMYFILS